MLNFLGFVLIVLASLLESFCTFGRDALPEYKPKLLKGSLRWVLEALWAVMLLAGGSVMLFGAMISGILQIIIAFIVFWIILPIWFGPFLQRRLLPKWDDLKKELMPKGFNENNYYRGDWWKVESKRRQKKAKPAK